MLGENQWLDKILPKKEPVLILKWSEITLITKNNYHPFVFITVVENISS